MKTIYLADDDEDDRMLIRMALEKVISQARIVELESGDQLIKLISNEALSGDPAVIIMDMNMPRMSGLETLAHLRADTTCQYIPIVMLSSTSHDTLVRDAYARGVNAFLEKPVHEAEFVRLAKAVDTCFLNASPVNEGNEGNAPTADQPDGSIVVIEDSEDHLLLIRHALRETMPDVHVIAFSDTSGVNERLATAWDEINPMPHLILMDLYLPTRQDGLDLLLDIHQLLIKKNCRSVPIIVFSYTDKSKDFHSGYKQNANAFIREESNASERQNDRSNLRNFWWNTVSASDHR